LPALPTGSILHSIAVDAKLEATSSGNFASDLTVLVDTSAPYTGDNFALGITSGNATKNFNPAETLTWAGGGAGVGSSLTETRTDNEWTGAIDLATTGLFLGNAYADGDGTWSGTITLTYEVPGGGSGFSAWANGAAFTDDANDDGVDNGLAWILGADNPNDSALGKLPTVAISGGFLNLSFTRENPYAPAKLYVEYGSEFAGWTQLELPAASGTIGGDIEVEVSAGPPDAVLVKIPTTHATGGKLFARLSATEN
jgi:hypothetical protein